MHNRLNSLFLASASWGPPNKKGETDLWLGDCLLLMKSIPDNSVDLILCDLPYGITKNQAKIRHYSMPVYNPWDHVLPLDILWKEYRRICRDSQSLLLTQEGMISRRRGTLCLFPIPSRAWLL